MRPFDSVTEPFATDSSETLAIASMPSILKNALSMGSPPRMPPMPKCPRKGSAVKKCRSTCLRIFAWRKARSMLKATSYSAPKQLAIWVAPITTGPGSSRNSSHALAASMACGRLQTDQVVPSAGPSPGTTDQSYFGPVAMSRWSYSTGPWSVLTTCAFGSMPSATASMKRMSFFVRTGSSMKLICPASASRGRPR